MPFLSDFELVVLAGWGQRFGQVLCALFLLPIYEILQHRCRLRDSIAAILVFITASFDLLIAALPATTPPNEIIEVEIRAREVAQK